MRRNLRDEESVYEYYAEVLQLHDILETLGQNVTDQEKADKLTNGLQRILSRDVTCLSPNSPSDFLMNRKIGRYSTT